MDDFDDFDNELDDILKNVIEEDKGKGPPIATPSKPSARISLFDDEPKINQGAATASKGNTFLTALFGSSAPTPRAAPQETQQAPRAADSSHVPTGKNGTDPLDAILSRTKARKLALQSQKQEMEKQSAGDPAIRTASVAQKENRTPQTRPRSPIEESSPPRRSFPKQDYSDSSSESDEEASFKTEVAGKGVRRPQPDPQEAKGEKQQPRQKATRGGLLDVDSLAGINIKKSVDRKPRESDNAQPSVEAEPPSINAHPHTGTNVDDPVAAAQKENSEKEIRAKTESEAQRGNDEEAKRCEEQVNALKSQLEQQQQLLLLKDQALQQAQESKSIAWQREIEQKLEKLSTEQNAFLGTIRDGFTDMRQRLSEEFEIQKLNEEQRLARERQIKLEQEQTRERFEFEVREKYEQMVDRINRANNLVVSKMKTEHERELMVVEKTKQQEVDQVTRAFDQTRSLRDLSNRVAALVSRLESLQHSSLSEFSDRMEKKLQLMERKISTGPARVEDLAQRLSIIADKATEAQDETRSEISRLRKEIRSFVDEQEDFRHMLLREHRGLVAQIVADRNLPPAFTSAQTGSDSRLKAFLSSWEEELARREKLNEAPQVGRYGDIKSSKVPTQSTNAAISQAMFIWRSYQQQENL